MSSEARMMILVAEDDLDDRDLTSDAMSEGQVAQDVTFVGDGEELLEYLERRGRYAGVETRRPALILLDLNMPRMDGRETLRLLKASPELRQIPVVVLTTSHQRADVTASYDLGASSFITKSSSFDGLVASMAALGRFWFGVATLPGSGAVA